MKFLQRIRHPNSIEYKGCYLREHTAWVSHLFTHRIERLSHSATSKDLYVSIHTDLYVSTIHTIQLVLTLYLVLAGDGVLSRLSLRSARRWAGVFLCVCVCVIVLCSRMQVLLMYGIWQIVINSPLPDWSATGNTMISENWARFQGNTTYLIPWCSLQKWNYRRSAKPKMYMKI